MEMTLASKPEGERWQKLSGVEIEEQGVLPVMRDEDQQQPVPAEELHRVQGPRKKPGKAKTGDAKEGKKKPVKQTDPLKDDFGNEVPKRCRDAWADTWIQETFDLLTVLEEKFRLAKLANGLKAREKRYPFFHSKDFTDGTGFVMQYLNSLITHIKDNRPAGVCPMCEGKGCADCRSAGMVPRDLYATLKKEANK